MIWEGAAPFEALLRSFEADEPIEGTHRERAHRFLWVLYAFVCGCNAAEYLTNRWGSGIMWLNPLEACSNKKGGLT